MHTVAMIMAMSGTRSELGFGQRHQMHQVRDICKSSLALINVTALSSGYDWHPSSGGIRLLCHIVTDEASEFWMRLASEFFVILNIFIELILHCHGTTKLYRTCRIHHGAI